jgi:hypothetical protein
MRRTTIESRWNTPRRQYSGNWHENPWINATSGSSQARVEVADHDTQDRQQQKAAIRIWEDEGGSIRTDGNVRC